MSRSKDSGSRFLPPWVAEAAVWRAERLALLAADQGPVSLLDALRLVVHSLPMCSTSLRFSNEETRSRFEATRPLKARGDLTEHRGGELLLVDGFPEHSAWRYRLWTADGGCEYVAADLHLDAAGYGRNVRGVDALRLERAVEEALAVPRRPAFASGVPISAGGVHRAAGHAGRPMADL